MFRRKATVEVQGEICPYCEFVNKVGETTCVQCYYELNKPPREQGESVSSEVSDSIFDELMSEEDDSWEDADALEVVLSLDQEPLEVKQYDATDFSSEEPEKIGFMESSSPEMHETVSHEPMEVKAEDVGKEIKNVPKLDFSKSDPFDEVPDPVHQGKGALFSPSAPTRLDDDLLGHVGGLELPSLPPDDLYENKIDLTMKKAPAPTPALVLPNLPDFIPTQPVAQLPKPVTLPISEPVAPIPANTISSEPQTLEEKHPTDENSEPKPVPEIKTVQSPPEGSETDSRIWPWPEGDAWDARKVHREVVSALELVKSGKKIEAASVIDSLGPHLTNDNVDLIYHIGMVLKQLERTEEVRVMMQKANSEMPANEHVSSAMAHLGI